MQTFAAGKPIVRILFDEADLNLELPEQQCAHFLQSMRAARETLGSSLGCMCLPATSRFFTLFSCRLSHKKAVLLSKASLAICLACVSVAAASWALPLSGKHVLASSPAPAPGADDCRVKDEHQLLVTWVHSQASFLTNNLSWALNALPQSNPGSCSFSTVHAT